MRFGILGETRAWHDDGTEVPLGGPARRALLALLLVRPGAVVSAERLAEEIEPGGTVSAHAVQSQVSRLRAVLPAGATIERVGAGYRILLVAGAAGDARDAGCGGEAGGGRGAGDGELAVDAVRFERLADEGRAALRDGDTVRAASVLRQALGLWRGTALAGLPDSESARLAAARLEELRLAAVADRIEAELRSGEPRAVVPELRELVGAHPLSERLAALLIRALFAQGCQAEALVVYEETRRHLADELGADPSIELSALHRELLDAGTAPTPAAPPSPLTSFVGRGTETSEVATLLRTARLVCLTGPGGVGKTRLSAEVARGAAAAGDDVCFVELAALRDGSGAARVLLSALGLRENGLQMAGEPQTPLDRLITALSDRPLLIVLDNCEHVVDEAAALAARLLTACPRLRILATSREPLGVIGEHVWQVRPLDEDAAVRLFEDRARAVRRGPAPDPGAVRRICAALDRLPLAIELVAARLRTLEFAELAGRLDDLLAVTACGSRGADARHRTLRSVVAWSWELLSEDEQRAARRFAVFAGGATARSAREVCGMDGDTLESLVDKSILEAVGGGRHRMLETVRAYAAERLHESGEEKRIGRLHAAHVLDLLGNMGQHLLRASQLEWLPRAAAEDGNLAAALRRALGAHDHSTALRLLASAATSLWIRGVSATAAAHAAALLEAVGEEFGERAADASPDAWGEEYAVCVLLAAATSAGQPAWRRHRAAAQRALEVAWPGDRAGRYPAALLLWMMRNAGEADPGAAFTLVAAQHTCPDPWGRAAAAYVSGYGPLSDGDTERAAHDFRTAADGFGALGDRWGSALALDALAGLAGARGDRAEAVALTDRALALTGELGALEDSADLLVNRGDQHVGRDPGQARADYTEAAALARAGGSSAGLGAALRGLGDIALLDGDLDEARRLFTEALERIDPHWVKSLGNRVCALAGLGRVAEARGDHAAARGHYRQAAASVSGLGPRLPDTLRLMGLQEASVEAVMRAG
ncbi:BTAD domain-containing putative transcriptional regulator [Streptomyces atratus]|uniref:BTAD domain-containing putative transcriptional regulator n=1 Tax=Streptomyces atratus TaxID=1893 RepID=UPI00225AAAEF|nr:BTAD domain-containing putative transcriptional regulator [Streptomyces atratus]MCX5342496.1 winged helix-turn-helix domain-containing protein [Streptomyces atratus]